MRIPQLRLAGLTFMSGLMACSETRNSFSEDNEQGFYVASDGSLMRWREGSQIEFRVDSQMPAEARLALEQAVVQYNALLAGTQFTLAAQPFDVQGQYEEPRRGDGMNVVYWVPADWPWKDSHPDSYAMTIVRSEMSSIREADIYFRGSNLASPAPGDEALSLAVANQGELGREDETSKWLPTKTSQITYMLSLHEFGHVLGRSHSHEPSIMEHKVRLSEVSIPYVFQCVDQARFAQAYSLKTPPQKSVDECLKEPTAPALQSAHLQSQVLGEAEPNPLKIDDQVHNDID